jgi:hypothetical protein
MLALAAMCLRRARVVSLSFAATPTHLSKIVTPPAPAAQNLGMGLRRLCRGGRRLAGEERLGTCSAEQSKSYWLYLCRCNLALVLSRRR